MSASDEIIIRRTYNPKLGPFAKNNVVIDEWNLDDYFLRLDGSNTMVGPINFEEAKVSQPPPTEIVFKDNKGFLKGILAPTNPLDAANKEYVDTFLSEKFDKIEDEVEKMKTEVDEVAEEVNDDIKPEVDKVKDDVEKIKPEIDNVKDEIEKIKPKVETILQDLGMYAKLKDTSGPLLTAQDFTNRIRVPMLTTVVLLLLAPPLLMLSIKSMLTPEYKVLILNWQIMIIISPNWQAKEANN